MGGSGEGKAGGKSSNGEKLGPCLKGMSVQIQSHLLQPGRQEGGQSGGWRTRQQIHNRATPEGRLPNPARKASGWLDLHNADPFSYLKIRDTEYKLWQLYLSSQSRVRPGFVKLRFICPPWSFRAPPFPLSQCLGLTFSSSISPSSKHSVRQDPRTIHWGWSNLNVTTEVLEQPLILTLSAPTSEPLRKWTQKPGAHRSLGTQICGHSLG